jgi:hypothetical protein
MADDWATDVVKYVPDADQDIITGIVRYCGIALRNRDSSLVSFSDKTETDRVKANFLKKKLGLTDSDDTLDAAMAAVGDRMKADTTKNRVTVYYLLASHFGRLDDFRPKTKPKPVKAAPVAAAPESVPEVTPEPVVAAPPALQLMLEPSPTVEPPAARRPATVRGKTTGCAGLLLPLVFLLLAVGVLAALFLSAAR